MDSNKDNIKPLRITTYFFTLLIIMYISISSLTTITSRQMSLTSLEADKIEHQAKVATIILNKNVDDTATYMNIMNVDTSKAKIGTLDPNKYLRSTNYDINKDIDKISSIILFGSITMDELSLSYLPETINTVLPHLISLKFFSSDALLGMLLITSGMIGSIMASIRDNGGNYLKTLTLGACVGFVSLLAVKGGASIFIMENAGNPVPFNAYSTAFAGVLAGIFSEKFYEALSNLMNKAVDQTKNNETSK